jgi:hypothetical protein
MAVRWSFDHLAIYRSLHLHLAIANDLSLVIVVARIDQEVVATRYQFNSYILLHIQGS